MVQRNDKKVQLWLVIGVGVCVLFYAVNHWLLKQLEDVREQMTEEIPDKGQKPVPQKEEDPRRGIPVIDPHNDPLAPVHKKVNPFKAVQQEQLKKETVSGKIYEFPIENVILPQ